MAKTFSELQALALQIRDEILEKKNTAPRVGAALLDMIDNTIQNITDINQKLSVFEHVCSGFKRVQSESQLPVTPPEDEKAVGYLVGKNLYLYVGKDGNAVNGRYFNVGDITGPQGEPGPQGLIGPVGPKGEQGNSGVSGSTDNIEVVNNLDGGESTPERIKVLAAEQGKVLKEKFYELDNTINNIVKIDNKDITSLLAWNTGYYDTTTNTSDGNFNMQHTIILTNDRTVFDCSGLAMGNSTKIKPTYAIYRDDMVLFKDNVIAGEKFTIDLKQYAGANKLMLLRYVSTETYTPQIVINSEPAYAQRSELLEIEESISNLNKLDSETIKRGETSASFNDSDKISGMINSTGEITSNANRWYFELPIPEMYRGGYIDWYSVYWGSANTRSAFYDENDDVILVTANRSTGRYTDVIPNNAVLFRFVYNPDLGIENYYINLKSIKSNTFAGISEDLSEKSNIKDGMLPIGVMDNFLINYIKGGGLIYNYISSSGDNINNFSLWSDNHAVLKIPQIRLDSSTSILGSSVLKINREEGDNRLFFVRGNNGVTYKIDENNIEGTLAVNNTGSTSPYIKTLKRTDSYITIYIGKEFASVSSYEVYFCNSSATFSTFKEASYQVASYVEEEMCGLFREDSADEKIDLLRRYYSRAEKLGSNLIGKHAVAFGDSLAAVAAALANEYGMNIHLIATGGARMNYGTGTGQGGETGTATSLWLCNDTIIGNFYNNKPQHIDFIINTSGANSVISSIGTSEDVSFVLKNKRWFHNYGSYETDPFDDVEEEQRTPFQKPENCYIAAFYSLTQLYPNAISVCCDTYRSPGAASYDDITGLTDNKWADEDMFLKYAYNTNQLTTNENIGKIAKQLGAIHVPQNNAFGIVNAPYYTGDGVHPNGGGMRGPQSWARWIFEHINIQPSWLIGEMQINKTIGNKE